MSAAFDDSLMFFHSYIFSSLWQEKSLRSPLLFFSDTMFNDEDGV